MRSTWGDLTYGLSDRQMASLPFTHKTLSELDAGVHEKRTINRTEIMFKLQGLILKSLQAMIEGEFCPLVFVVALCSSLPNHIRLG